MSGENQPSVVTVLQAALIHNGDPARLGHIRPGLQRIAAGLAGTARVETVEIFEQPAVVRQPWSVFLRRRAVAWSAQRRWQAYRGLVPRPWPIDALRLPRDLLANADRHRASVESILADKHIAAWRGFTETRANLLMVLEDDAVMRDDTVAGLADAVAQFDTASAGRGPAYIDLAGGFDPATLGIGGLAGTRHGRFREYRRPVTNTAGGYLMNRALAGTLVVLLEAHPEWRLLPADWLINRCFIDLIDAGQSVRCLHAEPTIFVHGSHAGTYSSTVN